MSTFSRLLALSLLAAVGALAETHTVSFENSCGSGTPQLIQNGNTLSAGGDFTSNGPLVAAIAFLQTGACGQRGEGCTLIETTLQNGLSISDISLIPPLSFSVATGFRYENGCEGTGAVCTSADCPTAFHDPDDTEVQVGCPVDDVNLVITFCG